MSAAVMNGCMYLLDAHSLIFQVFHAIPEMSSPTGTPTNALFGFLRDLLTIRLEKKPDYLVCAFDLPGPTFRDAFYPEYKAHRKPMPDDLRLQMPVIHELVEAMGIPLLSMPSFEADDVVATVAKAASANGIRVLICTTDKDCRQLIDDRVSLLNLRKGTVLDREALLKDWGVTPEQVVDLQSLVGDSVDNVPGIPGIGLKTAAKLLQEFGTVDNLFANIDKVAGAKKQESLRGGKATLDLSRRLVKLSDDVPIKFDWEGWRLRPWDGPRLLDLCRRCGFRSLSEQIRRADPQITEKIAGDPKAPRHASCSRLRTRHPSPSNRLRLPASRIIMCLWIPPQSLPVSWSSLASRNALPSIWKRPASMPSMPTWLASPSAGKPAKPGIWRFAPRRRADFGVGTDFVGSAPDLARSGRGQGESEHQVRSVGATWAGNSVGGNGRRPHGGRLPLARGRAKP